MKQDTEQLDAVASVNINPFAPVSMDSPEQKIIVPVYNHGFSGIEVEEIKKTYIELEKRDKNSLPLTLEEQIIVFKHFRITRTETFILNTPKIKKPPKEKKPKAEKKLTKKLQTKLEQLFFLVEQEILSEETMKEEDKKFWIENKHRIEEKEIDLFDNFPLIEATDRLG